jgi:hypothetical protein
VSVVTNYDKLCYRDKPLKPTEKLEEAEIFQKYPQLFKEAAFSKPRKTFLSLGRSIKSESLKSNFEYEVMTAG